MTVWDILLFHESCGQSHNTVHKQTLSVTDSRSSSALYTALVPASKSRSTLASLVLNDTCLVKVLTDGSVQDNKADGQWSHDPIHSHLKNLQKHLHHQQEQAFRKSSNIKTIKNLGDKKHRPWKTVWSEPRKGWEVKDGRGGDGGGVTGRDVDLESWWRRLIDWYLPFWDIIYLCNSCALSFKLLVTCLLAGLYRQDIISIRAFSFTHDCRIVSFFAGLSYFTVSKAKSAFRRY